MNQKNLLIVESPNKIKTIQSYVGEDYDVVATYGHLKELNKNKGFDPQTFEPCWSVIGYKTKNSKEPIIKDIKSRAKKAKVIYLATDPDREGEAISWHVWDFLEESEKAKCRRITFNEVTKNAVLNAIENHREIDDNLVYSQFTRRILDRLIGYKLSGLVKRTLHAISAGRVQSIALLFVVNREIERLNFVPSKWFEITALLENGVSLTYTGKNCSAKPYEESKEAGCFRFAEKEDALLIFQKLSKQFQLNKIEKPKKTKGEQLKTITTDKLLQMAFNKLGWGAARTTSVAQRMFEGIELEDNNLVGLISYPRTDSERLSEDFVNEAKKFICETYGSEYYNTNALKPKKTTKAKELNIQDAHEAIRPVNIYLTPHDIKNNVSDEIYRLYDLIWTRTVSVLMNVPEFNKHNLYFLNNNEEFYTSYKEVTFKGYYILDYYKKTLAQFEQKFPDMEIDQVYLGEPELVEKDKLPPPYYTEASLIAALKESGVGRPSTYTTMARIGELRGYIDKEDQKLIPTEIGMKVIQELNKDFPDLMTAKFTASMEEQLDKIANGTDYWKNYLEEFSPKFEKKLKEVYDSLPKVELEKVGKNCPECNADLVYRISKYGTKFIACSGFPKCKYTESIPDLNTLTELCPDCNCKLVVKVNKKHKKFIGCSNYPNCTYIKPNEKEKK